MRMTKKQLNFIIENFLIKEETGNWKYSNNKEKADEFRMWLHNNRKDIKAKYDITTIGSSDYEGLAKAYKEVGKEWEPESEEEGILDTIGNAISSIFYGEKENDRIVYDEKLPSNYKLASPDSIIAGEETFVAYCKETGCAEWVGSIAGWQGNAWHEHWHSEVEGSSLFNLDKDIIKEMSSIFSLINKKPKEKLYEAKIKNFIKNNILQDKSNFKSVPLGSIVGLYYPKSSNFTKAFFEGATGSRNMGKDFNSSDPAGEPDFFKTKNGDKWSTDLLNTSVKFVPTEKLKSGKGFGLNTHLGYVGAQVDGEPVIFHNIGPGSKNKGRVYATPYRALSPNKLMILWHKKPPEGWFDWLF